MKKLICVFLIVLSLLSCSTLLAADQNFGQIELDNVDISYNDATRIVDLYKLRLNTNSTDSLVVEQADGTDVLVVDTTVPQITIGGVLVTSARISSIVTAGNSIEGTSTDDYGVKGTSTNSHGLCGLSIDGSGLYAQSSTSAAVSAYSLSGSGLQSTSDTGRALYVYRNNNGAAVPVAHILQSNATDAQTALYVRQSGTGKILDLCDGATSVVSVFDGGNVALSGGNITCPRGSGVDTECFGATAGAALTTAARCTLLGSGAGESATSGESNTIVGARAADLLTTGGYNTVVGAQALEDATTASFNTVLGQSAGQQVITGQENTYLGRGAGYRNAAGNYNTCVGASAGGHGLIGASTHENTFIGYKAGYNCYTGGGDYNTVLGFQSAYCIQSGVYNVVIGHKAGWGTVGSNYAYNVFIGRDSGIAATSAQYNVFLGNLSGDSCTTGSSNICIGSATDLPAATTSNYLNIGGHLKGYVENASVAAWGTSGVQLQLDGNTYTDSSTAGSGTATSAVMTSIGQTTLAATNASVTTTDAATLYVAGPPIAGSNQTITTPWSIWIDSGNARIDGVLDARGPGSGVDDVCIGPTAGDSLTTGASNTLIGGSAGTSLTTGNLNTLIGKMSGSVATGSANTSLGANSAYGLSSGTLNTFIGYYAGQTTTTGGSNICIGQGTNTPAVDSVSTLNIGNAIKGDLVTKRTDFQGPITFSERTTLTIASGSITVTKGFHLVASQDVNPDDLTTIVAGTDGQQVILRRLTASAAVTVKDGSNLGLAGDFAMDGDEDTITLLYDTILTKWVELARSNNN